MEARIVRPEETETFSEISIALGNIPFVRDQSVIAALEDGNELVGFAVVQNALHAAGSWVNPEARRRGHSYQLRRALDDELRRRGYSVYFALPRNDFERQLFAKYGPVTECLVQVRHL